MKSYFAWCRSDCVTWPNPPFEFRCLASSWEDAVEQAYKAHSNVSGFYVLDCFEEAKP